MAKLKNFISNEILNLGVGYFAGLSASNLVSKFYVKKGLVNLWGLTAKKEAVSKDAYEWLMLISSYLIGLTVLLLVTYLMKKITNSGNGKPDTSL